MLHEAFDESFWSLPLMKRCQGLQMELLLNGYLLSSQGDRMLSAHAIEGRYPFLDEDVVQMAYNIPDALKLSGFKEKKYILKEAYSGGVPEAILNRKKFPYTAPNVNVFFLITVWIMGISKSFYQKRLLSNLVYSIMNN